MESSLSPLREVYSEPLCKRPERFEEEGIGSGPVAAERRTGALSSPDEREAVVFLARFSGIPSPPAPAFLRLPQREPGFIRSVKVK